MALPTVTPSNLADYILEELGDSQATVWTQTEIIGYIQKVIYDFKSRTLCSWKRLALNDVADQATYPIPESYNFHKMDRVEYDYWAVRPVVPRAEMAGNGYFETAGNRPLAYMMEGDGLNVLRKIGVPTADSTNLFYIEYFSIGAIVTGGVAIDLPLRYLIHIAHGVKAKAYEKDGDGQSIKMAAYWKARYEDGIQTCLRRKDRFFRRRISNIGNDGKIPLSARRRDPGSLPAYFPKVE